MKRYEQFPHTADIGVRVFGRDLKELFENAAFAMFDIAADLQGLKPEITKDFEIKADNPEELLISWLDELLYNLCAKGIIFSKFDISDITDNFIKASASGRAVAENRNRLKTEIKAATYHNLEIKKTAKGYEVEIVFDV